MGADAMICPRGYYLASSYADLGTVTATSELGDFVAPNMQSPQADLSWRGDPVSTIQIDLEQARAIDCIALCVNNFSPTALVTITLYSDRADPPVSFSTRLVGETLYGVNTGPFNGFGWNGVDVTYRAEYANFIEQLGGDSLVMVKAIDILVQDSNNTDEFIEVRRMKIGQLVKPDEFDYGYQFGFINGKGYRGGQVTWTWHNHEELAAVNEVILSHGADPEKLARTRSGQLLGFPDDVLWIGYPDTVGPVKYQHTALVALIGSEIPHFEAQARGIAVFQLEEIYHALISS